MDNKFSGMDLNSVRWSFVVGTTGGFDLKDQAPVSEDEVALRYGKAARKVYEKTGVYVSAVITMSRVVYHEDWGCPRTGEYAFTLSGSCNPAFADLDEYLAALRELAVCLKEEWKQTTILLEITPASVIYMSDKG